MSVARQVTRLATGLPPASPTLETFRDPAARAAGRPAERRSAVRISRRHRDSLRFSGRRRVPDQGSSATAVSGLPQGHGLAAAARRPPGWQAAEAVHGRRRSARAGPPRPVTPATASRALPAIPNGKNTCSSPATPGLEVRVPVQAGPRVVGVSFVRELWEPEGLPQPLQRGRVIANDQVYMDYANVGSVQIGGPYRDRRAGEGHSQPPRDFRLPAPSLPRKSAPAPRRFFPGWPGWPIAGR